MVHLKDAINDCPRWGWHTVGQDCRVAPLQQHIYYIYMYYIVRNTLIIWTDTPLHPKYCNLLGRPPSPIRDYVILGQPLIHDLEIHFVH